MLADRRWSSKSVVAAAAKFAHFGPCRPSVVGQPVDRRAYLYFLREQHREDRCAGRADGIGRRGLWPRRGRDGPVMRLPILALIVAAVLMPNWLFGSGTADLRFPVALPASARLDIQRGRIIGFLAALALVFLGVRVYVLTLTWRDVDSRFIEFHALRKGRSDCGLINAE